MLPHLLPLDVEACLHGETTEEDLRRDLIRSERLSPDSGLLAEGRDEGDEEGKEAPQDDEGIYFSGLRQRLCRLGASNATSLAEAVLTHRTS